MILTQTAVNKFLAYDGEFGSTFGWVKGIITGDLGGFIVDPVVVNSNGGIQIHKGSPRLIRYSEHLEAHSVLISKKHIKDAIFANLLGEDFGGVRRAVTLAWNLPEIKTLLTGDASIVKLISERYTQRKGNLPTDFSHGLSKFGEYNG